MDIFQINRPFKNIDRMHFSHLQQWKKTRERRTFIHIIGDNGRTAYGIRKSKKMLLLFYFRLFAGSYKQKRSSNELTKKNVLLQNMFNTKQQQL